MAGPSGKQARSNLEGQAVPSGGLLREETGWKHEKLSVDTMWAEQGQSRATNLVDLSVSFFGYYFL